MVSSCALLFARRHVIDVCRPQEIRKERFKPSHIGMRRERSPAPMRTKKFLGPNTSNERSGSCKVCSINQCQQLPKPRLCSRLQASRPDPEEDQKDRKDFSHNLDDHRLRRHQNLVRQFVDAARRQPLLCDPRSSRPKHDRGRGRRDTLKPDVVVAPMAQT